MPLRTPWYSSKAAERKVAIGLDPVTQAWLKLSSIGSAQSAGSALSLYEQSSIVSVPVNWIASAFASIRPVVEDMKTGEFTLDDEVLGLLRNPSPYYTGRSFRENMAVNYLVTAEAGVVGLGRQTRPPVELQPISPKDFEPVAGAGNVPVGYEVRGQTMAGSYAAERDPGDQRIRYFDGPFREMKTIIGFSTKNNGLLRGQSPLVSVSKEIRQHILGGDHNVSLLEKGGRLSMIFNLKEDLTDDEFREQRNRLLANYGGATEAGQIAVTAGSELQIEEVGKSSKDMDFRGLQELARMAVLLTYRMPLSLAFLEASTLDNYKIGNLSLFDGAVLPLADVLYGGLGDFLLPRYGMDPAQFRLTYDPQSIQALTSRRLEQLSLRKTIGIETIDELRATGLGADPYEPEEDASPGEFIYVPAGQVPLTGEDVLDDDPPIPPPPPAPDPPPVPPELDPPGVPDGD